MRRRRGKPSTLIGVRQALLALFLALLVLPLVAPPGAEAAFASTDVALVIDVSGSMEILAEIPQDFPHRDEYRDSLAQLVGFAEGNQGKRSLHDVASGIGSGVKLAQLEQDVDQYLQTHNLDLKEQSRLGAARRAAKSYLDLLELSRQGNNTNDRVALITFDTTLEVNQALTGDYTKTRQTLDTLEPLGGTNMGAGLQAALDRLGPAPATANARKQIILLTDGFSNEGLSSEDILNGPAKIAKSRNIPIYTIGFGLVPQTVDEQFLGDLASATGGAYVFADTPEALNATLLAYQSYNSGKVLGRFEGAINPGQQNLSAGTVQVPQGSQSLRMAYRTSTPDATVELTVTGPDGRALGKSSPGVSLAKNGNVGVLTVESPTAGDWRINVSRQDLGKAATDYAITAATEGTSTNLPIATVKGTIESPEGWRPFLILGSILFGGLALGFIVLTFRGLFSRQASTAGGCFSGCLTVLFIIVLVLGWGGYWLWNQPLFGT
jgi:hypothetical protein